MSVVLIVDDHVDTCHLMERLVRRIGPDTHCVHSGEAALAAVGAAPPSLVLLDISMPGIDGLETLRRLRETPASSAVPVVMLTAMNDDATRRRASDLGANDYLLKSGFDFPTFRHVIERYAPPPPPPQRAS